MATFPSGRSSADFLPFMVVEPPENPTFSTKKEKIRRGISKNESKGGFSGRASAGMPAQASGLSLHSSAFTLEIGLSFGVYYHHFGIKLEKAARQDDRFQFYSEMVRAARIELASLAWKAGILAIIRRPLNILIIISQSEQTYYFCLAIIHRLFQYLRLSY
jgi:hypothetical protein